MGSGEWGRLKDEKGKGEDGEWVIMALWKYGNVALWHYENVGE